MRKLKVFGLQLLINGNEICINNNLSDENSSVITT
jgi:hypothetical protein